ncbi:MAG TPA: zf-HC2 domain-containing protein [Thermomicrobiales bacterium]|nr:hypothetical protein [Chloroflexota bacterium]HBY46265.1 hypothetical protein [Chloroflexota bacterium]HCG28330.1 hypothetical protein [Chloroflexota bacterium]HQX63023.1 zf-HC2 domain-containing protein [Thermomicrobiales bacterium]
MLVSAEHDDLSGHGEDDDGHVRGLIPAFALHALDPDDAERVRGHIALCDACAAELVAYERAVEALPYAAPAMSVPLRARAALLLRIDEREPVSAASARRRERRRFGWLPASPRLAGALAAPALVLLLVIGVMGARLYEQQQRIEAIQAEQDRTVRTLAEAPVTVGSTFIAPFAADRDLAPDAKAKLIVNRESDSALIVAVDLPTPAEGQRYIVWMRFADGTDFANGGELRVDPDGGKATLMIQPFGGLARYEAVVITSEPIASTGGPSSPSLLTAVLGAP